MFCVCRNGWFHFKLRIPCDLVEVVGRSIIQYPLRLRKKRDANKMALELRDRLTPQFQRLRIERLTGASDEQLRSLAHEILPIGKTFRASVGNDTVECSPESGPGLLRGLAHSMSIKPCT